MSRKISREMLETFKSPNGAWCAKLLRCFGVNWPPREGWRKRIEGQEISDENFDNACRITREVFLKHAKKSLPRAPEDAKSFSSRLCACGNQKKRTRPRCKKCLREEKENEPCWNS